MSVVHIHAPQPDMKGIERFDCPDCNKRTFVVWFYTPWYGNDSTCLNCGREWQDGEWMALPFVRQSRQKKIAAAKAKYRRLLGGNTG